MKNNKSRFLHLIGRAICSRALTHAVLLTLLAMASGCATFSRTPAPTFVSQVERPTTDTAVDANGENSKQPQIVRSQNGSEYAPGTNEYFRSPMPAAQTTNGATDPWNQFYNAPPQPNAWDAYPPASAGNSAASAWNGGAPNRNTSQPATPNWGGAASPSGAHAAANWNGQVSPATGVPQAQQVQWNAPLPPPPTNVPAWTPGTAVPVGVAPPPAVAIPPAYGPPTAVQPPGVLGVPTPLTDIIVNVAEAQTGRLLVGAAVNSDAGVTGQIILDEKNFNWRRFPRGWNDLPYAFRGGGQGLRIEALPGNQVQRYMIQFTEPYLLDTRVSFNLSGFLFDRRYFDWDESRLGGRFGFGYRVTPDLSVQMGVRMERVEIRNPRVPGVPELDAALGKNELYGFRFAITQDTRDIPFAPTQGYYLDLSFEQVLGTFDYPRFTMDARKYFLITERPDSSGRHVLGFSNRVSITGSQTPIYENFFAGGYSTLRGFDFRGATPMVGDVAVGGELSLLGSVEYRFPVTADDMLQGVVFCDYGTVEEEIKVDWDDYRVALGAGLRISVPALSAAPIALDFAVPVAREDTDRIQNFAFFVGVSR